MAFLAIVGKKYMEKKALEKDYQQGVELIQEYVTDYLVKNYEGIEKIEWQGVGIEWRSSPIYGNSIMGNYVDSDVKIFVSEEQYFTITYNLSNETDYDIDLEKYVLTDYMNPTNIDSDIRIEIENTTRKMNTKEKNIFNNIKKNKSGSLKAEVIYDLEIRELKY